MVVSSAYGRVVSSRRLVLAGGSSRVLRKMLAAETFMRSHSWMMATFWVATVGETWTLPMSSRVASALIWRIFFAGRRWKQSGWAEGGNGALDCGVFNNRSAMAWATANSRSWSSPVMSRLCESRRRSMARSITATAGVPVSDAGQGIEGALTGLR